ncbi:MAG: (d)CMP kinase, partial [Propionibacteriaceae bacterium]
MTDQHQIPSESSRTTDPTGPLVIAIDGPSGSGKSSTARGVADRLGLAFLDTGAMYRAITWLALQEGVDLDDQVAVAELLGHASMEIDQDPRLPAIAINGVDVTQAIRAP